MSETGPTSWVYFAQAGAYGPVKIGYAKDVRSRLSSMQTGCPIPLTLLGVLPGGRECEAELHVRFAELRVRGEWFRAEGALAELLQRVDPLPKAPTPPREPRPPFDWRLRAGQAAVPVELYTPQPPQEVEARSFEFHTGAPIEDVHEPLVRLRYRRCPVCGEACHPWGIRGVKPHGPNGCTGDGTDWTTWPDAPHPDGPREHR